MAIQAWTTWQQFFELFVVDCKSILRRARLQPEALLLLIPTGAQMPRNTRRTLPYVLVALYRPVAMGSDVPLCRARHKGTYAEDPVMQRDSSGQAFDRHTHIEHLAASST